MSSIERRISVASPSALSDFEAPVKCRDHGVSKDGVYLSVVVPCYNEQACLPELCRRLTKVCGSLYKSYELILVDDGSSDQTWRGIVNASEADSRVVGIKLSRNFGQQPALFAGLAAARGDRILVLDADLQDPPEILPEMLDLMDQGAEVVYGRRQSRDGETAFKKGSAMVFYRALNLLSEVDIPVDTGDFRLLSRRALEFVMALPERQKYLRGMSAWVGMKQVAIEYPRAPRHSGRSHYSLIKMMRYAGDALIAFSAAPSYYAACLAALCCVGTVVLAGIAAYLSIRDHAAHWGAIAAAILLAATAAQVSALAIVSAYVSRIYEQVRGRPPYIVERVESRRAPSSTFH